MSYIAYLNGFNRWLGSNALEPVSQLLYFRLLDVFNCAGWPESVQVDNQRIMSMTGQHSEKSAIAARDRLISARLISYQRGKKGSPGRYALLPFPCIKYSENNTVENIHCISGRFPVSYPGGNREVNPALPLQPYKYGEGDSYGENTPPNPPRGEPGETSAEPVPEQKPAKGRKKATSQQDFPVAPFFPENPALEQVMADWLAYKRERRELPKTASGMKKLITQMRANAGQYGVEALAATVDECMSNDYQGIVWKLVPQKAREMAGNGSGRFPAPQSPQPEKSFRDLVNERKAQEGW